MPNIKELSKNPKRSQSGFTLMFAVLLSIIFAGLLGAVFYFLRINISESKKAIYESQAIYLTESGNARALARLNVKTLPDINLDFGDDEDEEGDDIFDEELTDEEFDELDLDDEDSGNEDEYFDPEDRKFLAKVPRYINFYLYDPLYVNIDTGGIVSEAQYLALIADQGLRIQANKLTAQQNEQEYVQDEILIEELYFPLPEVNVQRIGTIPIQKGIHLKPGFKLTLAQKVPIKLKQGSIVEEFYNYTPSALETLPRPILKSISPNFASPGEYLDIYCEGENIDNFAMEFASSDLIVYEGSCPRASIAINENAKPGKYRVRVGSNKAEFFIVPNRTDAQTPIITQIIDPKGPEGMNQFTKISDKDKIELRIQGFNLSDGKNPPLIVPDAAGITVEVISFKPEEIVCRIETLRPSADAHYISIFTEGGQSNSWVFNVEKNINEVPADPTIGTYSTVLTLLEVNSLSNLPIRSMLEIVSPGSGRPGGDGNSTNTNGNGGNNQQQNRPGSTNTPGNGTPRHRGFDLLRSDLETVWKLETIATVSGISYKETKIIRRNVPRIEAALTTNIGLSFGQSSILISGVNQAQTRLEESSSSGDLTIFVEGDDPYMKDFIGQEERDSRIPTGEAVVEDFGFKVQGFSPTAKGFTPGGLITIVGLSRRNSYSDFAFVDSLGPNSITVKEPGFQDSHFIGDDVYQIIPSVITPQELGDRESQRSLDPPGSFVNIPDVYLFEYVFRSRLDKIIGWTNSRTDNLSVPTGNIFEEFDGYFGLNIIEGEPSYTGANVLYGQGTLIVDTTEGGINPSGGTVTIGGSSKLPAIFDGVIYVIGNLNISGPISIQGGIVVYSPQDRGVVRISGSGDVKYNLSSIRKSILHLPFVEEIRSRIIERVKGQEELLKE